MAKIPVNLAATIPSISALELLRDAYRGLADAEAGRVTSHEEARLRLIARYS
jgi:predicted transcriptional regulator